MPFWQTSIASSSSSSSSFASSATVSGQHQSHQAVERSSLHSSIAVSSMAKSFLPTRRRLRLDPSNKLFFPCMIFCLPLLSSSWFLWLFTVLVAVVVVFFFLFWGLWFLYDLVVLECVFLLNFLNCDLGLLLFFVSNSWFVNFGGRLNSYANCSKFFVMYTVCLFTKRILFVFQN